ncbi:MAG TPA: STAS domain-containing protein [Gemmataceae bacterium]|nr:STAS domain-containing protein [Gemmataceae bacterium]
MKLEVLADADGLFHVGCAGDVSLAELEPREPLSVLLGPGCYRYHLLLNFDQVTFLDTAGVSWLIRVKQACDRAGGRMVLHSVPPIAAHLLQLLRMHEVFAIGEDERQGRVLASGGAP